MPISDQIVSFKLSSTNFTGTADQLNYTSGVTAGAATASKAVVLDSNKDVSGLRNINTTTLNATNIAGTLTTNAQPNVTSIGTLNNLTVSGNVNVTGHNGTNGLVLGATLVSASAAQLNYNNIMTIGTGQASKTLVLDSSRNITNINSLTTSTLVATTINLNGTNITSSSTQLNYNNISAPGTAENSKTLVLNSSGNISGINTLSATSLTGTLTTAAQTAITSVGTLTNLTIANNLIMGSTTITESEIGVLDGVTPGSALASKALILNSSKGISGITSLTTTGLTLGSTTLTATGTEINTLAGVTAGTISASKAVVVDSSKNLTGLNSLSLDSLTLNGTTYTDLDIITSITAGTISASKAVVVDSNKDISGFRNISVTGTISGITTLTATSLAGTLTTASQPNITSVGTLSSVSIGTINSSGVLTLSPTGASVTLATNKNLVLSGTGSITGASSISATNLTGTLQTVDQPNITSLGTLTSLTLAGTISGVTTLTATSLAGTLTTAAQTAITSVGTLSSLSVSGTLTLGGTAITSTAAKLNFNDITTLGSIEASKAAIVDSNKDISGFRNITATGTITAATLAGTLSTAAQTAITSVGNLTGLTTAGLTLGSTAITATGTEINTLAGVTAGTVSASKAIIVDSNKDISGFRNISVTGTVSGVTTLTATSLAGTLTTPAQTAITSVGNLTGLTTAGLTLGSTAITATGAEINTLAGVTAGTVSASKAIVVDTNKDISGFRNITVTGTVSGATTLGLSGILTSTDSTTSTSNSTGSLKLAGGLGISNTTDATSSTNGGTFTSAGGGAFAKSLFVGNNLTVGGNLTITGTTTTVNSTTVNVTDNTIVLNSGPSGTGIDAGILTQRYQNVNDVGTGDVVGDTATTNFTISSGTTTTIVLPGSASAVDNYYTNWWIKMTSGPANNNVRQVTNYVGSTKTLTLGSALSGTPAASNTINLYNNIFPTFVWQESNKRFITATTTLDSSGTINLSDYADLTSRNIVSTSTTTSTSNSTGALKLAGGLGISNTTDATSATNGGTFTSAGGGSFAKALFVGTTLTTTGLTLGSTSITATGTEINTLAGVTAGTASASKALILDSNKDISGIRTINLNQNLNRPLTMLNSAIGNGNGITFSLGKASALDQQGEFGFNYLSTTGTSFISIGHYGTPNILNILSNGKVGIGNTSPTYTLDVTGSINSTSLYINTTQVTAAATELNTLASVTAGTASASKAIVLDSNKDISGIRILTTSGTASGIRATNTTSSSSANILFTSDTYNMEFGTRGSTSTNPNMVYLYYNLAYRMLMNTSGDTSFLSTTASTSNSTGGLILSGGLGIAKNMTIGGTAMSASAWGTSGIQRNSLATTYTDSSTTISGTAASAVITSFGQPTIAASNTSVTTTNAATVYIANAPSAGTNMTLTNAYSLWIPAGKTLLGDNTASSSVTTGALVVTGGVGISGSLYSSYVYTGSLILGGTTVTASATELNYIDISSPGTAEASKALVLDSNKDIYGIRTINITNATAYDALNATMGTLSCRLQVNSSGFTYLGHTSANDFALQTNNTGRIYIKSGGNVGIANSNPGYTLDVTGNINASGNIYIGGSVLSAGYVTGITEGTATASKALVLDSSKNISGINTMSLTSTAGNLITLNNSSTTGICNVKYISDGKSWELGSRGSASSPANAFYLYDNTAGAHRLTVDTNGNLGIGTTGPGYKLDVNGSINASSNIYIGGSSSTIYCGSYIGTINSSSFGIISSNSYRVFLTSGGNVGINRTDPSYSLDVSGAARITSYLLLGTSTDTSRMISALDSGMTDGSQRYFTLGKAASTNNQFEMNYYHSSDGSGSNSIGLGFYGSSAKMTVRANGCVGIGTTSPSYALDVSGAIGYTLPGSSFRYRDNTGANGAYSGTYNISARFSNPIAVSSEIYVTSDSRIKTNITEIPIELAKAFIIQNKPVSFNYIESRGGTFHYGYIAQDIIKNGFEKLINFIKDDELEEVIHEDGSISPAGICLHVAYQNIIPILGQNIRNIYEDNEKLENKVQELENKNQNLENKVQELENKNQNLENKVQNLETQLDDLKQLVQSLLNK